MCGIAGIVVTAKEGAPPALEALRAMAASLRHRGPDESGCYRDARAGLAHARLSIIDLVGGRQPLADAAQRAWISYNGEIYNYVELRRELASRGHRFVTASDTEVIVAAWLEWGEEAFARMNGQFALALWIPGAGELVLARDRFGVRPLYIAERPGRVLFASEVKAIFAGDPSMPRAFDPLGFEQTFTFWSVVPPQGIFDGVVELRPGHVRRYRTAGGRAGELRAVERPFARPAFPPRGERAFRGDVRDAAAALRAALDTAVRLRIERADVPVGSYLSGGIDSSLIAALGRGVKGDRFHTFSIRFEDAEFDETPYQRLVAERIGSEHHEVMVSRGEIARAFPEVVRMAERPVLRAAPAPLYLLSRLVRDAGFKVVTTGEGADEMLAGYDLFREAKIRRFWARQPGSTVRPRLLDRLYPYLARSPVATREMARAFFGRDLARSRERGFGHRTRWQTTSALKRLFSAEFRARIGDADVEAAFTRSLPDGFDDWSCLAQDQEIEIETLFSGYLLSSQGDRMLMAHSVEGRFPFLDPGVVALAESLPPEYKLAGLDEKHVLKRAARGIVPEAILARPKQPYRVPDAISFTGPDAPEYVGECLSAGAVRDAGVFEPALVGRLWRKCREHAGAEPLSNADNMALIGVLSTQLLHQAFIARAADAAGGAVTFGTVVDRLAEASC